MKGKRLSVKVKTYIRTLDLLLLANISISFKTELLNIMDEAKHLAEARKRMKMENAVNKEISEDLAIPSLDQDKTVEDREPTESRTPKRGDNHVLGSNGAVAAGTNDEQSVEELHNLQAEK
jgi:hypothetical protein